MIIKNIIKKYLLKIIIFCLILIFNISFFTLANVTTQKVKRIISIAYDDSWSMWDNGQDYAYASFALQNILALMNENDKLNVIRMSSLDKNVIFHADSYDKRKNEIDEIKKYLASANDTTFKAVDNAVDYLMDMKSKYGGDDSYRYYLLIVTDGKFGDYPKDMIQYLNNISDSFSNSEYNAIVIGIGDGIPKKLEEDVLSARNNYFIKCGNGDNIIDAIFKAHNIIYHRQVIDENDLNYENNKSTITFNIDNPLRKVIVFENKQNVGVISVKSSDIITKNNNGFFCEKVVSPKEESYISHHLDNNFLPSGKITLEFLDDVIKTKNRLKVLVEYVDENLNDNLSDMMQMINANRSLYGDNGLNNGGNSNDKNGNSSLGNGVSSGNGNSKDESSNLGNGTGSGNSKDKNDSLGNGTGSGNSKDKNDSLGSGTGSRNSNDKNGNGNLGNGIGAIVDSDNNGSLGNTYVDGEDIYIDDSNGDLKKSYEDVEKIIRNDKDNQIYVERDGSVLEIDDDSDVIVKRSNEFDNKIKIFEKEYLYDYDNNGDKVYIEKNKIPKDYVIIEKNNEIYIEKDKDDVNETINEESHEIIKEPTRKLFYFEAYFKKIFEDYGFPYIDLGFLLPLLLLLLWLLGYLIKPRFDRKDHDIQVFEGKRIIDSGSMIKVKTYSKIIPYIAERGIGGYDMPLKASFNKRRVIVQKKFLTTGMKIEGDSLDFRHKIYLYENMKFTKEENKKVTTYIYRYVLFSSSSSNSLM